MNEINIEYLNVTNEKLLVEKINNALKEKNINFYYVDGKTFETKNEILNFYKERENVFFKTNFTIKRRNNNNWLKEFDDGILKWTPTKINRSFWRWDTIDFVLANLKEAYPDEKIIFKEKRSLKKIWLIFSFLLIFVLVILILMLVFLI